MTFRPSRLLAVLVVLAAVIATTLVPSAASAAPTVATSTRYYLVYGATEAAIRSSLDQRGPGDYDAETTWYVDWSYRSRITDGRCVVASRTVKTRVNYLYPSWRAPASASEALRTTWRTYMGKLRLHELGHGRIGLATGVRIDNALRLGSASTCTALDRALRATIAAHFRTGNAADVSYDRRTRHGETQGAVFP